MRKIIGEAKIRSNTTISFNAQARRALYYAGYVCDEAYLCIDKIGTDGVITAHFANVKESTNCRRLICAGFDWLVYLGKKVLRKWYDVFKVRYYKPCFRVKYELIFEDNGVKVKLEPMLIEELVKVKE